MAECKLCGDNEEVEIVCTVPGAPQIGTVTSPCPDCLAREKDTVWIERLHNQTQRKNNRISELSGENAKLRAERDQLREACHIALDTVQWDHGREVYAKLVRALDSTEMNHG